jgi:hypothetical protein
MIVTKEQQESILNKYIKENHNTDECIGFVDGINAALNLVNKLSTPNVMDRLPNSNKIRMKAIENDEKEFNQWWWETVYKG